MMSTLSWCDDLHQLLTKYMHTDTIRSSAITNRERRNFYHLQKDTRNASNFREKPMDSRFSYLFSSLQLLAGSSSEGSSEESLPSLSFASAVLIPLALVGLLSLSSSRSCKHLKYESTSSPREIIFLLISPSLLLSPFLPSFSLHSAWEVNVPSISWTLEKLWEVIDCCCCLFDAYIYDFVHSICKLLSHLS